MKILKAIGISVGLALATAVFVCANIFTDARENPDQPWPVIEQTP